MNQKYYVVILFQNKTVIGKSFESETDCWNESNRVQKIADENELNIVCSVRSLSDLIGN